MKSGWLLTLLLVTVTPVHAQLTIQVSVPASTPAEATVYVAGGFNNWHPGAAGYALTPGEGGAWSITLPENVRGKTEFKFTLGSWETVETAADGSFVPNRVFTVPETGPATYSGSIAGWKQPAVPDTWPFEHSTVTPSVSWLSEAFEIPQLGRTRRIWLYLPPDYNSSSKSYPVLYMHDGQNVFDAATSFVGEWGVDEALDRLHGEGDPGVIVVAIDNGGTRRMNEYNPYTTTQYGAGEGDAYVRFIVETLKPYIDANYRTRPDRLNTGIMGSSMGGLISFYAFMTYPEVFGRAGVFSPSFWIAPEIYTLAGSTAPVQPDPRIYLLSGALESASQVDYQRRMVDTLEASGFQIGTEVDSLVKADGQHSEWFWRREFPAAYKWLFSESGQTGAELPETPGGGMIELYPNPALDQLTVLANDGMAELVDSTGRVISRTPLQGGSARIDVQSLPAGVYFVRVGERVQKWVKL